MKTKFFEHMPHYIAEFIGTFFLVFFGCGSVVLLQTTGGIDSSVIPFVFGGTIAIMIYAVGHISGAHFNPAVTLAFWAIKRFPAQRLPGYWGSQVLGAILASVLLSLFFGSSHDFGATTISTSTATGFGLEFVFSFALMFVIAAVATDARAVGELAGIAIGTTVTLCAFVGGPLTGASMNPARSLGPAILSGQMSEIWIYLLAPAVGTVAGAKVYDWIRCHREEHPKGHGCC